ncbi:acylneuraminate cytidylyltransferase family protein [Gammaproteobacteria bacterium]|nr:acylneuraminate cytidylyltransferase family protein [Gammaproteobacteria bacterium]
MKILGLIPARAGSKGIKNKNIIDLGGIPLVEHTFKFASNLKAIDKLALSSDSNKIIEICSKYKKIEVPFMRPKELSTDSANISDVSLHILEHYKKEKFTHLALFQPTTPFRNIDEITNAINVFKKGNVKSIFSVNEITYHPSRCITIKENSYEYVLKPPTKMEGRQFLQKVYSINGSFYMCSVDFLKSNKSFMSPDSVPVVFSKESSFDIDDQFDLERAKQFYELKD